jgi:hypothetical protein
MTVALPFSALRLVVGLALLMAAGFGLLATRSTAPTVLPVANPAACDSCDARHARLADLRAQQTERTK